MRVLVGARIAGALAGCGHMDRRQDGPVDADRGIEHTSDGEISISDYEQLLEKRG